MPSPTTVTFKALSAALALSLSSSLPVHLVPFVLLIVSQYAFAAFSETELILSFRVPRPFISL